MRASILLFALCSCRAANAGTEHHELEPDAYCAKLAQFTAAAKPPAELPCRAFVPIYEAMRKDNAAYYSCSARCVEQSTDFEVFRACETAAKCTEQTSPPVPWVATSDERLETYCHKMIAIDHEKPLLGMWTCAVIASAMRCGSPKTFDCAYDCAMSSSSQSAYQECARDRSCNDAH